MKKETLYDIATVPNAITTYRLAKLPKVAKKLHDEPANNWRKTALYLMTDNIDGAFARLEDKSPSLQTLGFRRSISGKKLDPVVDRLVGSTLISVGLHNKVIPKWLGAAALGQKALAISYGIVAEKHGHDTEVSKLGKKTEALTNFGMGMQFAAEGLEEGSLEKERARQACQVIAVVGIAGAVLNTAMYVSELRQTIRSNSPSEPI